MKEKGKESLPISLKRRNDERKREKVEWAVSRWQKLKHFFRVMCQDHNKGLAAGLPGKVR